jgi:hypothetical protein
MVDQVQQTLDTLFWPLSKVLGNEGINALHWAILKRAQILGGGVQFAAVIRATGQSKDNVRRAAKFLANSRLGEVIPDPKDHRARIFQLNRRGRDKARYIEESIQAELLTLIGANLSWSQRARDFTRDLLNASGFLPPGDLANHDSYQAWGDPDDSRGYYPDPVHPAQSPDPDPDLIPF